jgi:hypothetical protein
MFKELRKGLCVVTAFGLAACTTYGYDGYGFPNSEGTNQYVIQASEKNPGNFYQGVNTNVLIHQWLKTFGDEGFEALQKMLPENTTICQNDEGEYYIGYVFGNCAPAIEEFAGNIDSPVLFKSIPTIVADDHGHYLTRAIAGKYVDMDIINRMLIANTFGTQIDGGFVVYQRYTNAGRTPTSIEMVGRYGDAGDIPPYRISYNSDCYRGLTSGQYPSCTVPTNGVSINTARDGKATGPAPR